MDIGNSSSRSPHPYSICVSAFASFFSFRLSPVNASEFYFFFLPPNFRSWILGRSIFAFFRSCGVLLIEVVFIEFCFNPSAVPPRSFLFDRRDFFFSSSVVFFSSTRRSTGQSPLFFQRREVPFVTSQTRNPPLPSSKQNRSPALRCPLFCLSRTYPAIHGPDHFSFFPFPRRRSCPANLHAVRDVAIRILPYDGNFPFLSSRPSLVFFSSFSLLCLPPNPELPFFFPVRRRVRASGGFQRSATTAVFTPLILSRRMRTPLPQNFFLFLTSSIWPHARKNRSFLSPVLTVLRCRFFFSCAPFIRERALFDPLYFPYPDC